jgi:hypothetical protein
MFTLIIFGAYLQVTRNSPNILLQVDTLGYIYFGIHLSTCHCEAPILRYHNRHNGILIEEIFCRCTETFSLGYRLRKENSASAGKLDLIYSPGFAELKYPTRAWLGSTVCTEVFWALENAWGTKLYSTAWDPSLRKTDTPKIQKFLVTVKMINLPRESFYGR